MCKRSMPPFPIRLSEIRVLSTLCHLISIVFQRNVSQRYGLKMKASRALYSAIAERFPTLPFSIRHFERRELLGLKVNGIYIYIPFVHECMHRACILECIIT